MSKTSSSSGIGFIGLLQILFIALKLTGNVNWSWGLVLAPMWVPIALFVVVFLFTHLVLGKKW